MTVFSAAFSAAAISAAQDLFEIVAPSDSRIRLLEIDIGQYSDFGDAAEETDAVYKEIVAQGGHIDYAPISTEQGFRVFRGRARS